MAKVKEEVSKLERNKKDKDRDEINLIYITDKEDNYNIFGKKFVDNNEDNIELDINGEKSKLINKYKLRKGENNIKMKIKNKIKDLQYMFNGCENLKNKKNQKKKIWIRKTKKKKKRKKKRKKKKEKTRLIKIY